MEWHFMHRRYVTGAFFGPMASAMGTDSDASQAGQFIFTFLIVLPSESERHANIGRGKYEV